MSTHNICFHGEIRKIFTGYPLLSRPMPWRTSIACFLIIYFVKKLALFAQSGKLKHCELHKTKYQPMKSDVMKWRRVSDSISQDILSQNFDAIQSDIALHSKCITVFQLGFEGRGVPGRALFVQSYKYEGTMCHVMCLVSRHVTKYNPIPQSIPQKLSLHKTDL